MLDMTGKTEILIGKQKAFAEFNQRSESHVKFAVMQRLQPQYAEVILLPVS
jgi:hypothetical protein